MEIKNSPLIFEDFNVLACSFATVQSDKNISQKSLSKIPVDIDFDILFNKTNSSKFKILIELNANEMEKPIPGYIYSMVSETTFQLKGISKLEKDKKDQFILFTALPLAVSMIRSYLYNVSAHYPFGKYLLPSIDLIDLFNKKFGKPKKSNNS